MSPPQTPTKAFSLFFKKWRHGLAIHQRWEFTLSIWTKKEIFQSLAADVTSSRNAMDMTSPHHSLPRMWRHLFNLYLGGVVVSSLFTRDMTSLHITLYQGFDVTSSLFTRDVTSSHHSSINMTSPPRSTPEMWHYLISLWQRLNPYP